MKKTSKALAVLIVEDLESDAQLLIRLLKKADYELVYEQVETAEQMRIMLEKRNWDIVISDYSLPQFDGRAALSVLKETGLDIPFIIVSGMMGEETAVDMMKAGAQDYLMKDNLARLIPAVERELEQAEMRRERKQNQEQLLLQSSALNAAANAIVITDCRGTIEWVNQAFNVLTGYTLQEAIGKNPRDLVNSGVHDKSFYKDLWNTILAGEVWHGELINRRKDGSLYTEEETITPLKNAEGVITHFIAVKKNISARKQSEAALAASEVELRTLFTAMQDVVLVIDRQGLYRKVAPTNPGLLVKPASELLGNNLRDIFPNEQAEVFIGAIQQVLDTKQTTQIEYELLIDGQTVYFETSISPMDKDCTLWVARDISERKQAESALAASENELRALVEQVPATVYTESAESRETIYISPQVEKLTGYTPAEWINDRYLWKKIIHPEDLPAVLAEDERTTETHEPFYVEYRILTRDGRTLWIHDEAVMIKNQDGTPLFWQGVMYDITERKQIEKTMEESERFARATVDALSAHIAILDENGMILAVNRAWRDFSEMNSPAGSNLRVYEGTNYLSISEAASDKNSEEAASIVAGIRTVMSGEQKEFLLEYPCHSPEEKRWFNARVTRFPGEGPLRIVVAHENITRIKLAEELLREQSEQLRLLYEASQKLNRTLDLDEIYQTICDFMSSIVPNDCLVISAFDSETQLITCRAYWIDNHWLDVSPFPSIPLEADGKGTQSIVIRTGQPLLVGDYQAKLKTAQNSYCVNGETNEVTDEVPPEEEVTRSALIVPLKIGGKISGVIQVMSYRLNAYTEDQLKLLEALALHIASAEQNALLYAQMQKELSERKQVEKSLRENEEQYRTLVEQLPAIVFIDDANVMGRSLYISPQIETILGFPQQEWLERSPEIWQTQVHPDDLEWVHAGYIRCFLYGEPHVAEYRIRAADGRVIWLRDQAVRLSDENGNPHLIHGVMYDITERKQAEEALKMSEERYRELFNGMMDGFALHEIICDTNGKPVDYRFLEINPAFERLTGLRSEDLIGKTVLEVLPNTEPYWIEVYGNVALTGRSMFFENYSRDLNRHFEVSVYCPRQGQFAVIMLDITDRKRGEENIHQRVTELEMLYQSGLVLNQSLDPKEIGQKILELLEEKLYWRHTRIRLYHTQDDSLELLDFNRPGSKGVMERRLLVEHFQTLITRSDQGMSGWVIQHGQTVRSGDVCNDPRYVEAYPGIRSGLYVPMKLGERTVGVISIEEEQPDAFSEADERLIVTLANQAASAFENARLFEETRQRVLELETINRISLVLRAVTKQNEMLAIVLDEALAILSTSHGSIELYNKTTDCLDQTIMRGWLAQVTAPHHISEGIAGKVFTSGERYITREFVSDRETRDAARSQIPANWGGICLPIRTTQQTLGVMIVSMPSEHELSKDEIRLLVTLSEMMGAALQRMQLHEQTIRRLEQLHALRAIDQAIVSKLDMSLTLDILIDQTLSQLGVDAAAVLLLPPGSNLLKLVVSRGFHMLQLHSTRLSESFAAQAVMEHRVISADEFEVANKNPKFGKLWKEEGFACYWCVPLIVKGEVKGVMEVYFRKSFTPDPEWLEFLEALAGQAAITIDTAQLFDNLQRANMDLSLAYEATIEGWSRAMDLRDHETEGHTLRVTDLTVKLAHAMRISESQLIAIRRGALLHDIGKMGIPDAILLKEGNLTDEEWVVMRQHPNLARDMLLPIAYLNDALDIPYCHHEKWNGTGYPQGLKGDSIPLVARIFAIVDVWDALTNNRTYRKKWTKQKARQYIKEQSGIHFDPQVVDAFLKSIGKE